MSYMAMQRGEEEGKLCKLDDTGQCHKLLSVLCAPMPHTLELARSRILCPSSPHQVTWLSRGLVTSWPLSQSPPESFIPESESSPFPPGSSSSIPACVPSLTAPPSRPGSTHSALAGQGHPELLRFPSLFPHSS